jgi:chromosome partitioning protein
MGVIIAVANQKGGVGKTTTAINLGAALAELDQKTLLIDLDPQSALSAAFGIGTHQLDATIYNVMLDEGITIDQVVHQMRPNLDLVPANIDLAAAEIELVSAIGREYVLREVLNPLRDQYNYLIIDSPPSLGLLTINALTAADEVIIPLQAEFLALRGMGFLLDAIQKVRTKLNPQLTIRGILGTMYKTRSLHAQEVMDEITDMFGAKVFPMVIKSSIRFAEAPVAHQSIMEYEPEHDGARAYRELAEVIVNGQETSQS